MRDNALIKNNFNQMFDYIIYPITSVELDQLNSNFTLFSNYYQTVRYYCYVW